MPVEFRKFITRKMMRAEPDTLFVFGDNYMGMGLGGQAREMRGEPNAVGLPTKANPSHDESAYLDNYGYDKFLEMIPDRVGRLVVHLVDGGLVVWPEDGIGTGLADLANRAPKIRTFYDLLLQNLARIL